MRLTISSGFFQLRLLNHFDGMMLVFVLLRMFLITNRHHCRDELNQPQFRLRIDRRFDFCQTIFAIYPPAVHGIYSDCLGCQTTALVDCNSLSGLLTNFAMYVMMYAKMPGTGCDSCSCDCNPWYSVMLTNLGTLNGIQTLSVNGMYYSNIRMCYANDHLCRCRTRFS